MDWTRAIEINREALTRIVAGLFAFLGLQADGMAIRLPRSAYLQLADSVHKAESAVRRLIVIAARGLEVPLPPPRPMPPGLVIVGKGTGRRTFQLFDTRKHFGDVDDASPPITGPRIRMVDEADPRALFLAKFPSPAQDLCSEAELSRLSRRLEAVKRALEALPRQAKRMAQWRARRALTKTPKFTEPMRPGPPPGHRKKPRDEIDDVLRECHGLAWDVLRLNTS